MTCGVVLRMDFVRTSRRCHISRNTHHPAPHTHQPLHNHTLHDPPDSPRLPSRSLDKCGHLHGLALHQCPQDRSANLPVRSLERALAHMVGASAGGVGVLLLECGAVVHERRVPLPGIFPVERLLDNRQDLLIAHVRAVAEEMVDDHRTDVGLDEDLRPVERVHRDGSCGCRTNARQAAQHLRFLRQHAAEVAHKDLRCTVQEERAAVVAKALPRLEHLGKRSGCQ